MIEPLSRPRQDSHSTVLFSKYRNKHPSFRKKPKNKRSFFLILS